MEANVEADDDRKHPKESGTALGPAQNDTPERPARACREHVVSPYNQRAQRDLPGALKVGLPGLHRQDVGAAARGAAEELLHKSDEDARSPTLPGRPEDVR